MDLWRDEEEEARIELEYIAQLKAKAAPSAHAGDEADSLEDSPPDLEAVEKVLKDMVQKEMDEEFAFPDIRLFSVRVDQLREHSVE